MDVDIEYIRDVFSRWSIIGNYEETKILNKMIEKIKKANNIDELCKVNYEKYIMKITNLRPLARINDISPKIDPRDKTDPKNNLLYPLAKSLREADIIINKYSSGNEKSIIDDEKMVATGFLMYMIIIFLSYRFHGKIINIELIVSYVMVYILSDKVMDDSSTTDTDRTSFLTDAENFMDNPDTFKTADPINIFIAKNAMNIINNDPESREHLCNHIKNEIELHRLQKGPLLSEQEYLEISEKKGGYCSNAINSVIGSPASEADYNFGYLMQLCDDVVDIEEDITSGINSIATYHFFKNGYLDGLVFQILKQVDCLSGYYNSMKPICTLMILSSISTYGSYYSPEMRLAAEQYGQYNENDVMSTIHKKFCMYYDSVFSERER